SVKTLTVDNAVADNKVYDANTTASISNATLVGVATGDDLNLNQTTGSFDNKNVGSNKVVTAAITVQGADSANYSLTQPGNLTANITAKTLTVDNAVADNKVYDANTTASISNATLVGLETGDDLNLNQTAGTFDNKNVGSNKVVTAAITVQGADSANYSLTQPGNLTASITAKTLTIDNAVADNKVYDANTTASISNATLVGVATGDDLNLNQTTGSFDNKNVGLNKVVTAAITVQGADSANYSLTQPAGLQANITAKTLTVDNAVADNKVYDANTTATISNATLIGVESGDDLNLNQTTGSF